MEVHKHPRHVTHSKKWFEYFLEFTMIFFAVFLGFVAENIRERKVEYTRSEEFAKSLIFDLQNDTIAINKHMTTRNVYVSMADSLLMFSKKHLDGINASKFSYYTRFMYWSIPVSWSRTTFEQIKNSGSLRYFKEYKLLEKLMRYDGMVNGIQAEFINHQTRSNMLLDQINLIIDPYFHDSLSNYNIMSSALISDRTKANYYSMKVPSLENKRNDINHLLNMVIVQKRNIRSNNLLLLNTKALAKELINDLKKEYNIE